MIKKSTRKDDSSFYCLFYLFFDIFSSDTIVFKSTSYKELKFYFSQIFDNKICYILMEIQESVESQFFNRGENFLSQAMLISPLRRACLSESGKRSRCLKVFLRSITEFEVRIEDLQDLRI